MNIDDTVHYVASQINYTLGYSHFNIKVGLLAAKMSDAIIHQLISEESQQSHTDIKTVSCPRNMSGYVYTIHKRILCVGMQANEPGSYVSIVTCRVHDMIKELATAITDGYTVSVLLVDQFNYKSLRQFMSLPSITEINVEPHYPLRCNSADDSDSQIMYRLTPQTRFISTV